MRLGVFDPGSFEVMHLSGEGLDNVENPNKHEDNFEYEKGPDDVRCVPCGGEEANEGQEKAPRRVLERAKKVHAEASTGSGVAANGLATMGQCRCHVGATRCEQ